jgi:hypothetical protein
MNPPAETPGTTIWKDIADFPKYEVSDTGLIRNKRSLQIRAPDINSRGYERLRVQQKSEYCRIMVHRAVAKAFIPNPLKKACVDHIDGNPRNNKLSNLRWTTHSENMLNTKMKTTKKTTRYKNIIRQGDKYRWKVCVNSQIHKSDKTYATEEAAHADFLLNVKKLSEFISIPPALPAA